MEHGDPEQLIRLAGDAFDKRYQLLSMLGRGRMSVVFLAEHLLMKRKVAIKILLPAAMLQPKALERFRLEAMAVSGLEHTGIVKVFDFGVSEQCGPFLVMEFLEGETLAAVLEREGRLPTERALEIFLQLSEALSSAHSVGVIHRDIKPGNIMLRQEGVRVDSVKLLDFGLAKVFDPEGKEMQQLTATGQSFASPLHMSPEQCLGRAVDCRSDLYSLGCVMYQVLGGSAPHNGASVAEIVSAQVKNVAPTLCSVSESIPPALDAIVQKAIKKSPDDRFQSADELSAALRAVKEKLPGSSKPERAGRHQIKFNNRSLFVFAGIALLLALTVMFLLSQRGNLLLTRVKFGLLEASRSHDDREFIETGVRLCRELLAAKEYSAAANLGLNLEPVMKTQFEPASSTLVEFRALFAEALWKQNDQSAALKQVELASHALRTKVVSLLRSGNYKDAESPAGIRWKLVKGYYPERSDESLETRQVLATIYLALSKFAELARLIDGIIPVLRDDSAIESRYLCFFLQDRAILLDRERKIPECEATWKRIIAVGRTLLRSDEYIVNSACRNVAELLLREGRLKEAEQYAQRALQEDRRWAAVLCLFDLKLLAAIYAQMKNDARANECFEAGIKLCAEHTDIADLNKRMFYREYARFLKRTGKAAESQRFFQLAKDTAASPIR